MPSYDVTGMHVLAENGGKSLILVPKTNTDLDWSKMGQTDPSKTTVTHFKQFQLECHHQVGFFIYWIINDC